MNVFRFGSVNAGRVVIDGREFVGRSVSITGDGMVVVDGAVQSGGLVGPVNVVVHGDAQSIDNTTGNVEVTGSAGSVSTISGNVRCGNVSGGVQTMSGDVTAQSISGGARSVSGDIRGVGA